MNVYDFLTTLNKMLNVKTLYVMGGWGFPLNPSNKERTQSNEYNRRTERKEKIFDASSDTFSFDCCGMVKSAVWGWCANVNDKNGGAKYATNGLPDWDAKEIMFKGTTEQSKDFSSLDEGEFLWLDGHCGVYLGNGFAIESTPKWKDGVQITAVANMGSKSGYNSRTWTYHGHLKCIEYNKSQYPSPPFDCVTNKVINYRTKPSTNKNDMIGSIKRNQTLTIEEISGDFGKITGWVYMKDNIILPKIDGYTVGNTYTVNVSSLNVRTGASVDFAIVTDLKKGSKVVCKSITHDKNNNTWMRISSPVVGWIACIYDCVKYVI